MCVDCCMDDERPKDGFRETPSDDMVVRCEDVVFEDLEGDGGEDVSAEDCAYAACACTQSAVRSREDSSGGLASRGM